MKLPRALHVPFLSFVACGALLLLCSCAAGPLPGVSIWIDPPSAAKWKLLGSPAFSAAGMSAPSIAIDASNTPYVAFADWNAGNAATVLKFNGTSWVPAGPAGFSAGFVWSTSLVIGPDGMPIVGYKDSASMASVMRFNGSSWAYLGPGPGVSAGGVDNVSLAIGRDGALFVAYEDYFNSGRATVKKYDPGTNAWLSVAFDGFTPGSAGLLRVAVDQQGEPWVVFQDGYWGYQLSVMSHSGGSWAFVDTEGFLGSTAQYLTIAFDPGGVPYIGFEDDGIGKAHVMKLLGPKWTTVGIAGFSSAFPVSASLALGPGGVPFIAYQDQGNGNTATVMQFTGTDWNPTGPLGFSPGVVAETALAIDMSGHPFIVFQDAANLSGATVMSFQ